MKEKDGPYIRPLLNIKKEDTKSFQTAELEPFFDLKSAANLFVITNFKN